VLEYNRAIVIAIINTCDKLQRLATCRWFTSYSFPSVLLWFFYYILFMLDLHMNLTVNVNKTHFLDLSSSGSRWKKFCIWFFFTYEKFLKYNEKEGRTHFFGLVATPHVLRDVLDAVDRLFDLRWHHGEGHHGVDALRPQLTRYRPHVWCFRGLLPMLAGARAFLTRAAVHGRELTVPELQTVERASSDLHDEYMSLPG